MVLARSVPASLLMLYCIFVILSQLQLHFADLRTVSVPHYLCLVNNQLGSSPFAHAVVSNLSENYRAVFSRPMPVDDRIVGFCVGVLVKANPFSHRICVVQMSQLLQDLQCTTQCKSLHLHYFFKRIGCKHSTCHASIVFISAQELLANSPCPGVHDRRS